MLRLFEELTARGIKQVSLHVEHTNHAGIALYEKIGFKKMSFHEHFIMGIKGRHAFYMRKDL